MNKYDHFVAGLTKALDNRHNGDSFCPIVMAVWRQYYRRHDIPQVLRDETQYEINPCYGVLAALIYQNMVNEGKIEALELIFKNLPPLEYSRIAGEVFAHAVANTINL